MKLQEYILSKFSKEPDGVDYSVDDKYEEAPLNLLRREYPDLSNIVENKRVIDFGCGEGKQALALTVEEDCYVCGLDTNETILERARSYANERGISEDNIKFYTALPDDLIGTFDVVISQNAMEHFPDPKKVIIDMKELINRNGKLLITFGPPWYAPYGSHMHFFCKLPWINIFFSEKAVMSVRALYRSDGATSYVDVESGLNKMSLHKFETLISECGLEFDSIHYGCVKGITWLSKLPVIREMFVNHVTCSITIKHV